MLEVCGLLSLYPSLYASAEKWDRGGTTSCLEHEKGNKMLKKKTEVHGNTL